MAQFDVYVNANADSRDVVPYLLDLQAGLLDGLATRVVAPLVAASAMSLPAQHLNPCFRVKGAPVVMSTAELAGIPVRMLGAKVASLEGRRAEIIAALDLLFSGI